MQVIEPKEQEPLTPVARVKNAMAVLDVTPIDLAEYGINYHTLHGFLHRGRKAETDTALAIVAALQTVSKRRRFRRHSFIPVRELTVEKLFS